MLRGLKVSAPFNPCVFARRGGLAFSSSAIHAADGQQTQSPLRAQRAAKLAERKAALAAKEGGSATLSLKDFMLRAQILHQYRSFHRTLRDADMWKREDLKKELREGFRQHSAVPVSDVATRKALLADGSRQLELLRRQLGFSKVLADGSPAASVLDPVIADKEKENKDDERYRMGEGWPWQ